MTTIKTLLVEDSPFWLEFIKAILEQTNAFDLSLSTTLAEALEYISKQPFELIITDLELPDSDASNTLIAITSRVSAIPIVVLTSSMDDKLLEKALNFGVEDFILKQEFSRNTFLHAATMAITRMKVKTEKKMDIETTIKQLDDLDERLVKFDRNIDLLEQLIHESV